MLQRIQTVYLLLALILVGLLAWLPLGDIIAGEVLYEFTIRGVFNAETGSVVINGWPLIAMLAVIEVLQLIIVFGFKNRVRQMRIAVFNILIMLGFFAVVWFFVHLSLKELVGESKYSFYSFKIPLAFPIVAAILNYLAIRAIGKDEALVRSIDRIR
ncbi:MAG: DUF4293 domain-containing protein [Prolixibacteraceae bacterium]|nr:DUF4293 domain-containing protein [Prolixibacteraceae bacterium]MBN2648701.1 DUF4293 domain-containing protein [Prolixibacteraceae bacterium]